MSQITFPPLERQGKGAQEKCSPERVPVFVSEEGDLGQGLEPLGVKSLALVSGTWVWVKLSSSLLCVFRQVSGVPASLLIKQE